MTPTPTLIEPSPAQTQREQDTRHYRQILNELIDLGTELARAIQQQGLRHAALTPTPANPAENQSPAQSPAQDNAQAFERVTRAVRRTMLLAEHLANPKPATAPTRDQSRTAARKQILRKLEDQIHQEAEGGPESPHADSLRVELLERLDAPGLDDEILTRTVEDIITDIRRDLGIATQFHARPWKRRTPHAAATLHARAAAQPGRILNAAPPTPQTAPQPSRHPAAAPPGSQRNEPVPLRPPPQSRKPAQPPG